MNSDLWDGFLSTVQGSCKRHNAQPPNVCGKLRHWDAAQRGTQTSM